MVNKVGNKIEYEFYNEEQKKRYINKVKEDGTKLPPFFLERLFTRTCGYEKLFNKDICQFKKTEIIYAFRLMSFMSLEIAQNVHSQLRRYTSWCMAQGFIMECVNHFEEIRDCRDFVNIKAAKRKMITRQELIARTSQLGNACDRFALLAIFEGINGKDRSELIKIRTTDFNEDGTVTILRNLTNISIPVSDELRDLAFESAEMEEYEVASGRRFVLQKDPTLIIKHFMACKEDTDILYKGRRIYFRLNRCLSLVGLEDISINSVSDSGKIHLINEIAKQNGMSGREVIYNPELCNKINYQFGSNINRSIFSKKYEEYLYNGND